MTHERSLWSHVSGLLRVDCCQPISSPRNTVHSLEQAVPYSKLHCTLAGSVYEAPDDRQQLPLQTLSSRLRNNLRPIGDRL